MSEKIDKLLGASSTKTKNEVSTSSQDELLLQTVSQLQYISPIIVLAEQLYKRNPNDKNIAKPPHESVICRKCPYSTWIGDNGGLKAYCGVTYAMVWTTAEPSSITLCDGPIKAAREAEAELERQNQARN